MRRCEPSNTSCAGGVWVLSWEQTRMERGAVVRRAISWCCLSAARSVARIGAPLALATGEYCSKSLGTETTRRCRADGRYRPLVDATHTSPLPGTMRRMWTVSCRRARVGVSNRPTTDALSSCRRDDGATAVLPPEPTCSGGCDLGQLENPVLLLGWARPEHLARSPLRAWVDFT